MFLTTLAAVSVSIQAPASAPSPVGLWKTPVENGRIRVDRCGDALCGYVADSDTLRRKPDQADIRNHDPALRNRPIMGLLVMKLNPLGPGRWGAGWIYDPRNGGTFTAKIAMAPDGRLRLTGCLAPLLCQTQTWIRAG